MYYTDSKYMPTVNYEVDLGVFVADMSDIIID